MNHSSMHPCCWCDIDEDNLHKKGKTRTFATLLEMFFNYFDANVDRSKAKEYGNVIHTAIIHDEREDLSTPVIQKVPPPELHLLLGPTQHIIDELTKVWPGCDDWLRSLNVVRTEYFGGAFEGNDCRKIVKNASSLVAQCPDKFKHFADTLEKFDEVVRSCYGYTLSDTYKESIAKFTTSYLKLGISVTPKVHAVMVHVEEFCEYSGTGLGPYSEQTSESLHQEFNKCWKRYFVKDKTRPIYGERLLAAVRSFNSNNI